MGLLDVLNGMQNGPRGQHHLWWRVIARKRRLGTSKTCVGARWNTPLSCALVDRT